VLGLLPLLQDPASRSTLAQQHWAAQPKPRRGLERAERQLLALLDGRVPRRERAARH
jgi:hypothetical protein